MEMKQLVTWAKSIKAQTREQRLKYQSNALPKIDAYIQMIIDRGEIITTQTVRMQKFMEEIQEGLQRLDKMGVAIPTAPKEQKSSENPLRP